MLGNDWILGAADEAAAQRISTQLGLLPLTARLLVSRGYDTVESADDFINKSSLPIHDPFMMKDMELAVTRIQTAIAKRERIYIYGDYDVDGVTATALLYKYLLTRGVRCGCFIPERLTEGYGLNAQAIAEIAKKADLIITVDTGVTAVAEVEFANTLGIDVIVTDHHSCRDVLPPAYAVVNPQRPDCGYPFKELAGVGVAFKLICALDGDYNKMMDLYGDIVALGTIADVMPVIHENRVIIDRGLRLMQSTKNLGLAALLEHCGAIKEGSTEPIRTTTISYFVAPRLNAAGRIASAATALDLLLADDPAQAQRVAMELCEINKQRQLTEQKIYNEAEERIKTSQSSHSHVLGDENWHQGVIGVIASKISEKYSLPTILFSFCGDIAKGSGRSSAGFNLIQALGQCADLLVEYGGHQLAAGLTVKMENFEKFAQAFDKYAKEQLCGKKAEPLIETDCDIHHSEITLRAAEELLLFEPCGLGNKTPLFLLKNAQIKEIYPLSSDKHIKITIKNGDTRRDIGAVYFGMSHSEFPFFRGDTCDLACSLTVNEYNNVKTPQLLVRGVRPCEHERRMILESRQLYKRAIIDDEALPDELIPTLDQFRDVFRVLRREFGSDDRRVSVRYICKVTSASENKPLTLCTLKIILDVLEEFGLLKINGSLHSDQIHISIPPFCEKVNLEDSTILKKLRERILL